MHQELQGQVAEKEGLHLKLQQLYATLSQNPENRESVDNLF